MFFHEPYTHLIEVEYERKERHATFLISYPNLFDEDQASEPLVRILGGLKWKRGAKLFEMPHWLSFLPAASLLVWSSWRLWPLECLLRIPKLQEPRKC